MRFLISWGDLVTGKILVDIETGQMKFWLNEKEMIFNVCQSIKKPKDMPMITMIDNIDEDALVVTIEERLGSKYVQHYTEF